MQNRKKVQKNRSRLDFPNTYKRNQPPSRNLRLGEEVETCLCNSALPANRHLYIQGVLIPLFLLFLNLHGTGQTLNQDEPESSPSTEEQLINAVENADLPTVKKLLRKDVDPNILVPTTNPEYQFQIQLPLLNEEPNAPTAPLINALHANALHPNTEILQLLLKEGARVNATDNQGKTPLMYAL